MCTGVVALHCIPAAAQGGGAIALHLDASRAVQGWLGVHETIPVSPGTLTLQYPKWIPGEHAPSGPLVNVAGLKIAARGQILAWTRDPVDLFAYHLDVPAGVSALEVDFTYLAANAGNYSSARTATPNLLSITWNKFVLTPRVEDYAAQTIVPSITLPGADWKYATALATTSHQGADVTFAPVSQETLVDSPLDAGINARTWDIGSFNGAPVTLAAFADTAEQLAVPDKTIALFSNLVTQMRALYRHRHFDRYVFLLTLSDVMPGEGVEHHQSSDNGSTGDFLTDHAALVNDGDLLPHEFNHSWDGKFRRPFDLATRNLQAPMIDDLLWVYEGMTQFYGDLQAERSGIWTKQEWLDALAETYARLDDTRGRDWRPLLDTATAASTLYSAPREWEAERRSVDYYDEGNLMWLEADVLIRKLSRGKRSIDDVTRAFFGHGADTGAAVLTYNRADIIAALGAVQPYDWAAYLAQRIDRIAPHPPNPFDGGGYKLTFSETPTALSKLTSAKRKSLDMRYSLGIVARADGTILDVVRGTPAYAAGIGPGQKIVAVNSRTLSNGQPQVDDALKAAKTGGSIRLLLSGGDVYHEVTLEYRGGPRFAHLERVTGTPDVLSTIARPLPAPAR
ncbi:MAG: M61 family metallopeptidase [Candidatus Velthaea sp.]